MRKTGYLFAVFMIMLILAGCTSKYVPQEPESEIVAIDIVNMEGADYEALKNAEVLAHVDEENIQQFMDELGALTMVFYSPPPQILKGTAIRIQYANGNLEEVSSTCSVCFHEEPPTRSRFIDWGFRKAEFEAFLSPYLEGGAD